MSEVGAAPIRVLVVGFVGSIHTVRAVRPMVELGWDVHVFASHPHWPDRSWRGVTLHLDPGFDGADRDPSVQVRRLAPSPADPEPVIEGLSWRQRVDALARTVEKLAPDFVDSMEIQHGGYLMLEAGRLLSSPAPPWVVHNWGSDVFYYGANPRHSQRLREVLGGCDFYGAECHRDIGLARAFGFSGRALPVFPNPGGFDLERAAQLRREGPSSARRTIVLKASNFFVYRPRTALAALDRCGELLAGHRLALYTATADVEREARELAERRGMELEVVSTAEAPVGHDEILAMHGRARVSISLSLSDAICTSFLEAMLMGSFPIQSDTSCAPAWSRQGSGAFFVDPEDEGQVATALRSALTDDSLVDSAALENAATAASRLDHRILLGRAMDVYERLAVEIRSGAREAGSAGLDPKAMTARLRQLAQPCGCEGSGLRREELAMQLLESAAPSLPRTADLLGDRDSDRDCPDLADDLLWVIERQAEYGRGQELGVAAQRGEVGEPSDGWYDGELVERDAHIDALRHHVRTMQESLDGFHRRLEAELAAPRGGWRSIARRLLPAGLRTRLKRRLGSGGGG